MTTTSAPPSSKPMDMKDRKRLGEGDVASREQRDGGKEIKDEAIPAVVHNTTCSVLESKRRILARRQEQHGGTLELSVPNDTFNDGHSESLASNRNDNCNEGLLASKKVIAQRRLQESPIQSSSRNGPTTALAMGEEGGVHVGNRMQLSSNAPTVPEQETTGRPTPPVSWVHHERTADAGGSSNINSNNDHEGFTIQVNRDEEVEQAFDAYVVDEEEERARRHQRVEELRRQCEGQAFRELVETLPHAEEMTPEQIRQFNSRKDQSGCSPSKRAIWVQTISVLAVLVSIVVVATVLALALNDNNDDSSVPSREKQLLEILMPISGDSLWNESSPRYKAFQWLLHDDPMHIDLDNNNNNVEAYVIVERYVLALLYFVTGGPTNWTSDLGFLSNTSVCNWVVRPISKGVACHPTSESVWLIQIAQNNLYGTLPPELSAMKDLEVLYMVNNELYGTIPTTFKSNRYLKRINLQMNSLTGTIPDLSGLRHLRSFEVYQNRLVGTIPQWLTTTPELRALAVAHNQLTGTLPDFAALGRLERLFLQGNMLEGTIPKSIGQLLNVEVIGLFNNMMTGPLPESIGQLKNLIYLWWSNNFFTGTIPTHVGLLEDLENLEVNSNDLRGTIPTELGMLSKLSYLAMQYNDLTGSIPSELVGLEELKVLALHNNSLTGGKEDLTDMCYVDSGMGLERLDHFWTDCIGTPKPEVDCPCCTTCCNDETGECNEMQSLVEVCNKTLTMLEESSSPQRLTQCECSEGGHNVSCVETNCLHCNDDGTICYVDSDPGITFGIRRSQYAISIQYVRGRNEHVTFRRASQAECTGAINGVECNWCNAVACLDGFKTFELDCSNIAGLDLLSACHAGNDPFSPIWDVINQLDSFDKALPIRYECL